MNDLDRLFERLERSEFRRRFRLGPVESRYLQDKGLATILEHGERFVRERLASANPANDGKQTPFRNHPFFIAQHATATCCRGCLEKWHRIPRGRELNDAEVAYILNAAQRWLVAQDVR
ncbi:MAG: DUF4186 domain-containing protein [Isosphaeraceae bacterium]